MTPHAPAFCAPLSFSQERLLFFDRLSPGSPLYAVLYRLELEGAIDAPALERAFVALIARHEVLRSRFIERDHELYQEVLPHLELRLPIDDLASHTDPQSEVGRVAREFGAGSYDLQRGPLVRVRLLRLGELQHVLLIGLHHIVFDGPSAAVLARELDVLYVAAQAGREALLPELPIQYADFSQWQRQRLASGEFEQDLEYWRVTLAGAPTLLDLPTDRPRPAVRSYAGRTLHVDLPAAVSSALLELSQRLEVTPFIIFSTLINVLLARYSGQSDVCLGFPVAGRGHPDLEGLIGFFSNTLVLRPHLSPELTFRAAAGQTQDCVLGALEHAEMPFDKLVEALAPERSLAWHPLFQVCVVYQSGEDEWRLGAARGTFVPTDVDISKFDLTFYYDEGTERSVLRIEYSTELFEPASIERLQRNLLQLCLAVCAAPDEPLSALNLLSDLERDQVLAASRGRKARLPRAGLASLFEEQVWRTPSQVAVQGASVELNYAQLDARAERVARRLHQAGVGVEDRVAIVCARGPEMLVGILGILKVEAAYVPLDPGYPSERLRFMVADSHAVRVLGDTRSLALLPDWGCPALDIEAAVQDEGLDESALPNRLERPDLLAYVMYTSGSTGRPKGVGVEHRAITRLVMGSEFLPFTDGLRFAQLSSFSFDASTLEFWGALLHGGTLVLFEDLAQLQPELFRDYLSRNQITSLFITVALLTRLVEARPDVFTGVQHLMYGGDRADAATLQKLRAHGFDGECINGYGPTETTTFACTHPTRDADIARGDIPIGAPIANTDTYILSPTLELAPVGVAGELYIGGPGLARGYFERPALTAERFVPNPFSETPGTRLYRTGDRCLWNADGTIRYLGRVDDQVKIDGFRIELEEVRLALLQVQGVTQAAVHVQLLGSSQKRLVGYVVADEALTGAAVKQALRATLPRFMVPGQVHPVPALPLTANGKVDFRTLEQQCQQRAAPDDVTSPQSELAARFFGIVADVLGIGVVRADDRFFDIGGTSLTAMRVLGRVDSELARQLPLSVVFQAANLGEVATSLESLPRHASSAPQRVQYADDAPLSFPQQRLFFFDRLSPGSALYAVPYRFDFVGELDVPALECAFLGLIERHEVLRSGYIERAGAFFQQLLPDSGFRLQVTDLAASTPDAAALTAIAREFGAAPYDLQHGPVLRAHLLRLPAERHVLLVGLHHIVFDAASSVVMARELDELYAAARDQRAPRLPQLPLQYSDFARWQRERHASGAWAADLAYWKSTLTGAPTLLELPTDRPRPAIRSHSGQSLYREVPSALHEGLTELARSLGVTPFVIFSAALSVLLARYSGQDDVCLGFPVAGRSHPDLDGLIGFFANTLVLRPRIPPASTYREAIECTRACVLGALEHAEIPFDELVDELAPERSLGWHPLFQVCVVYQTGESHWRLGNLAAAYVPIDVDIAKFDITFTLEQSDSTSCIMAEYSDQLFQRGTVNAMLDALVASLETCIDNPQARTRHTDTHVQAAAPELRLRRRR